MFCSSSTVFVAMFVGIEMHAKCRHLNNRDLNEFSQEGCNENCMLDVHAKLAQKC